MDNFKGKKIAICGYGTEGKSLATFLIKKEPDQIVIFDEKISDLEPMHESECISIEQKAVSDVDFSKFDVVFRSPGVKKEDINCPDEKISTLTNLFFSLARGKIVGVTGTKGKSTTVLLIQSILKSNSKQVFVGGNIGDSPLDFIDQLTEKSYSILELSSFQLMDLRESPDVAVILPVFPDHLDYHQDLGEYISAKKKIFSNSEKVKVICAKENEKILNLSKQKNEIIFYSVEESNSDINQVAASCQVPKIDVVAAFAFAKGEGLDADREAVGENFKKLHFRIELIGEIKGVKFYNDSASTNPISTQKAIEIIEGDTALILGGQSKGLDIGVLCKRIVDERKIKAIYLFGRECENIKKELEKLKYDRRLTCAGTLAEVFHCLDLGVENILFSPAFASFDQYENYQKRGEHFNNLFEELKCKNI